VTPRCTGIILAGGAGRRFGGRDKGLLRLRGRPMAALAAAALAPQVDEVYVSIARHASRYRANALRPMIDRTPGRGPLAGLADALVCVHAPYAVTLPCDSSGIPIDYVARLRRRLSLHRADVCVLEGRDGLHPLHALIKTRLRDSLLEYLRGGGTAAHAWIRQQRWTAVHLDVLNLNNPVELRTCTIKGRRRR